MARHSPASRDEAIVIDLSNLYQDRARSAEVAAYLAAARRLATPGHPVILTGRAPVWLFLAVAHELHGVAVSLSYRAPALKGRDLVIFDHDSD